MSATPSQASPTVTGYALLGLLSLRGEMSAYGLKQLADRTLRFFWAAPAMSHVYSELERLRKAGLVQQTVANRGRRRLRRYSLSTTGERALKAWLGAGEVEFPVLKHEVVLRLFLGHLTGPDRPLQVLQEYRGQLAGRIEELRVIRGRLGTDSHFQYPAMVAEWGIRYYQEELAAVAQVSSQLGRPGL